VAQVIPGLAGPGESRGATRRSASETRVIFLDKRDINLIRFLAILERNLLLYYENLGGPAALSGSRNCPREGYDRLFFNL